MGEKDIRVIRHSDIVKFYKWISRSDKGKYNVVSALKTMLRYAWRNEDILKVPPFPILNFQKPEIEYFNDIYLIFQNNFDNLLITEVKTLMRSLKKNIRVLGSLKNLSGIIPTIITIGTFIISLF